MPVQIMPPMYRMLADEIKWAIDDVSPSNEFFLHASYRYRYSSGLS